LSVILKFKEKISANSLNLASVHLTVMYMCSVDVLEYILSSIYESVLLLNLTYPAKRIDRDNYDIIDYTH